MLCTPLSLFAQGYIAKHDDSGEEMAYDAVVPATVDLFALFIASSHLGVF